VFARAAGDEVSGFAQATSYADDMFSMFSSPTSEVIKSFGAALNNAARAG